MDKTNSTAFLTVTVIVSPSEYTLMRDMVEKKIQVKAPLDLLSASAVSSGTFIDMIISALSEYRDNAARKLQAEQEGEDE